MNDLIKSVRAVKACEKCELACDDPEDVHNEHEHLALLSAATCDACLRLVLAHLHERVGAAVINAIATTNRHDPDHVLYANVKDALRREFGEKTKEVGHE